MAERRTAAQLPFHNVSLGLFLPLFSSLSCGREELERDRKRDCVIICLCGHNWKWFSDLFFFFRFTLMNLLSKSRKSSRDWKERRANIFQCVTSLGLIWYGTEISQMASTLRILKVNLKSVFKKKNSRNEGMQLWRNDSNSGERGGPPSCSLYYFCSLSVFVRAFSFSPKAFLA